MKVTVKGILHWEQWFDDAPTYGIWVNDMTNMSSESHTYAAIKPVEFQVEIPDNFDPRPGIVEGLREQKQKILADAQMKANQIEEKIQQLLSIEYKPEEA